MSKLPPSGTLGLHLYPPIEPYDHRMMEMPGGHTVYVEQCGRPDGVPVVVLHGGPGGACSPSMRQYFDPGHYRLILFDQRGCGRSRPHASVQNNTTWDLVADIERIREALGIEKWIVFGGSWGSCLGLIYAQAHPDRVMHMILRGIFLMTQSELDWFYGGGAARFWPEVWDTFVSFLPEDERDDIIAAYHKRLFSGDIMLETRFAKAWAGWENTLASIANDGPGRETPSEYARAFARLENHYFINKGFLSPDQQILDNMHKIAHIPAMLVQGRYDMITPPSAAKALHAAWPASELVMIPRAGHALSEPGISSYLMRTGNILRQTYDTEDG